MQLPSWINPAPKGFGTAEHGKLSGDQYRTLGTINLPITLIRTWGQEDGRRLEMLKNFLHGIAAIEALGLLEVTDENTNRADDMMRKYLEGVKALYKGGKIQVTHHAALHVGFFTLLFGPVHGWRGFSFERLNYVLQSTNTNKTFGA